MYGKAKIKKIKDSSEDKAQAYICSWCLQNNLVPIAVPNGVNLGAAISLFKKYGLPVKELQAINAKQIILLKKEGLHVAFPDMIIVGNSLDKINILFMENKVKNNKPTELQVAVHDWLRSLGFVVEVSKNSVDAIQKIKSYFGATEQKENIFYLLLRRAILAKMKERKCHEA